MVFGMRKFVALAAVFLLGVHVHAEEEDDEGAVEIAEPAAEEAPQTNTDEEWESLKKNIMDSLPDDPEEEDEDSDNHHSSIDFENARYHITDGFPFIEYTGFLDEDATRDATKQNIHSATMTLTEAKEWCAAKEECKAMNHAGDAGEGPFEFFFKDYWHLSVEHPSEDPWTSYQKGSKISQEATPDHELEPMPEISAEDVMKEYGDSLPHEEL